LEVCCVSSTPPTVRRRRSLQRLSGNFIGRFAESDNHFHELFYHPGLRRVYNDHQTENMPPCFCRHGGGIEHMDIKRSGAPPAGFGPSEYFTGTIRLDPLFEAPTPARAVGVSITIEPGAREAWHSHQASSDADRDGWLWPGPTLGGTNRRDSAR